MNEEFIIIGQHMTDEEGVVLFVGEPVSVHLREQVSIKGGERVTMTVDIKPGYKKYRAATFAEAMAMYQATLAIEQS